jgi:peptide/nickel transport system ATP-binding protein/oligopeptide transport system ATP-binding protein
MTEQTVNTNGKTPLIEVKELVKYFPVRGGLLQRVVAWVQAVDNISFYIREGETVGLVGESGCGKTTVGRTMLRLVEPTSGAVNFNGTDVFGLRGRDLKDIRRHMQIIFQDPYASLDPRMPIGESISEGLKIHNIGTPRQRFETVIEMLRKVGLEDYHARRYPHEFSGGQRQRIGIARALALRPKFIVADEPVSALDVSIQSQVLNILKELQREFGLTYLFIAHNLSVVEHISDRVAVMYLGKMVEMAGREELFRNPLHPYTQALMSAIPVPDPTLKRDRILLEGDVPSPLNPPGGCRFHPRCPVAMDVCTQEEPPFREVSKDHWVACWRVSSQILFWGLGDAGEVKHLQHPQKFSCLCSKTRVSGAKAPAHPCFSNIFCDRMILRMKKVFRLLIVDDQHEVRRMLASGVKTLGDQYDVLEVPSAEEAMLVSAGLPLDLVVTDVRLPGISGLDLVARLQKRRPDLRTILITGALIPRPAGWFLNQALRLISISRS